MKSLKQIDGTASRSQARADTSGAAFVASMRREVRPPMRKRTIYQRSSLDPMTAPKAAQIAMATTYHVVTKATESTGQYMA